MATADRLVKLMFSWIEQREGCAKQLKKLADELETIKGISNFVECVGSSASVVGAASAIGAGLLTIFTAGAAAPALALAAGVSGIGGAAVSVTTKITEHFLSSSTLKEAQKIEKKGNETAEKIKEQFEKLKAEVQEMYPSADPDELDRHVMAAFMGATARLSGLKLNIDFSTGRFLYHAEYGIRLSSVLSAGAVVTHGVPIVRNIFTLFLLKTGEKEMNLLFAEGTKQLIKTSLIGLKTAIQGGAMVVGGVVGMGFALDEAIDNWTDLIKNNHKTEASRSIRKTADDIQKMCSTLREQFNNMRTALEEMARMQREEEEKEKARIQREEEEKARRRIEEEVMARRQREEEEKEKARRRIEEEEKEKARIQREEEEKARRRIEEEVMARRQREEEEKEKARIQREEEEKEKARRQREEEVMARRQRDQSEQTGGDQGDEERDDEDEERDQEEEESDGEEETEEEESDGEEETEEEESDSEEETEEEESDSEEETEEEESDSEEETDQCEINPTPPGTIRLALLNTRSMNNRTSRIVELITQNNLDVFLTTETWLQHNTAETVLSSASPEGFRFHSQQREGRGGGVANQFSEELQGEQLHFDFLNITRFEFVVTVVQHNEWDQPVVIINLYHPPGYNQERFRTFLDEFESLLDEVKKKYSSIIVTGDFNIHVNNEWRSYTDEFHHLLWANDLEQHVEEPTHQRGNTLDLVITTNVEVSGLVVRDDGISDHYTVYFNAKPKDTRKKTEENKNNEQTKRFRKTEE